MSGSIGVPKVTETPDACLVRALLGRMAPAEVNPDPILMRVSQCNSAGRIPEAEAALFALLTMRFLLRVGAGDAADVAEVHRSMTLAVPAQSNHRSLELALLQAILQEWPVEADDPRGLLAAVIAYADFLYLHVRWAEGVTFLHAATRIAARSPTAESLGILALRLGRMYRKLRRWEDAATAYLVAEDHGRSWGLEFFRLRGHLGRGIVQRDAGNLAASERTLQDLLADPDVADFPGIRSMALQDLSLTLEKMGRLTESIEFLFSALKLPRDADDKDHIMGDLGVRLIITGHYPEARQVLNVVIDRSTRWHIRVNAMIELMGLDALEGNRLGYETRLRFLTPLTGEMPPSMLVDFLVKQASAGGRVASGRRDDVHLLRALRVAETNRLYEWIFRIEALMREPRSGPVPYDLDPTEQRRLTRVCEELDAYV